VGFDGIAYADGHAFAWHRGIMGEAVSHLEFTLFEGNRFSPHLLNLSRESILSVAHKTTMIRKKGGL